MLYEFDIRDYVADRKWIWLLVTLLVLALDQATKYLVVSHLALFQTIHLLPVLNITRVQNTGAAFSLLSTASGWQRWFFVVLALAVSGTLLVWIGRAYYYQTGLLAALSLVLAGALGNAIDRIARGYVVDFIDVHYATLHWPAFNVADSAITLGVVLFVLQALTGRDRE
ncbi:MAG TPA: signal peptidase II [Gammaproteobacteria bacterium]|nr:signal peptidase II [Gammaproteobacteria bacterium]